MGRRILSILGATIFVAGCQTAPQQQETVETVETTVYVERQSQQPQVVVVQEKKTVTPVQPPQTLSILQVTDGQGCPRRDPSTYGVFLRSERNDKGLLCYYD